MRLPRLQFKLWRILSVIALIGVLIASGVLWDRRIQRLDRMALNQRITVESANANYLNAVLAREAAEIALAEHAETSPEQRPVSASAITVDQLRMLSDCDAKVADAEKQLVSLIQQIADGTYVDTTNSAPIAAFDAIRHFQEALNKRLAVARAMPLADGRGAVGRARMNLQADFEKARTEELAKKLILQYEQAYLKWLMRKRARPWSRTSVSTTHVLPATRGRRPRLE
jgi:hypothetical protein